MEWVGRTVNNYVIDSVISYGGTSVVYRASQPQLERWVAIKVLTGQHGNDNAFLQHFRQEAHAIAALRHPNILAVYDYGEEDGRPYLVMEYVPGGTLKDRLKNEPLTWPEASRFILPIADALAYAHAHDIVHCDVKPGNILLPRPDWPLLADFGLVKHMKRNPAPPLEDGKLSGTPAYASPEQLRGESLNPRADVYSLALVTYQLLAGEMPFGHMLTADAIMDRLRREPPPISEANPEIPKELEAIILRALSRDQRQRYADMKSFISALVAVSTPDVSARATAAKVLSDTAVLGSHPTHLGPHLVVPGTETLIPLPAESTVVLGRGHPQLKRQADIDLGPHGGTEAGVSRQHARLWRTEVGWFLEDLDSTNGTSLNMAPVRPGERLPLQSGDVIRCGRLSLVFYERA